MRRAIGDVLILRGGLRLLAGPRQALSAALSAARSGTRGGGWGRRQPRRRCDSAPLSRAPRAPPRAAANSCPLFGGAESKRRRRPRSRGQPSRVSVLPSVPPGKFAARSRAVSRRLASLLLLAIASAIPRRRALPGAPIPPDLALRISRAGH